MGVKITYLLHGTTRNGGWYLGGSGIWEVLSTGQANQRALSAMVRSAFCWRAASVAEPVANTPQKFLAVNHNTLHRATTKVEAGTVEAVRINPSSGSTSAITSDSNPAPIPRLEPA